MAKLTYAARKALPTSSFVDKKNRKYPIPDASHARNALARVSQFGSPAQKSKVRGAVARKFPGISHDKHTQGNTRGHTLHTPDRQEFREHTSKINKAGHSGRSK